MQYWFIVFRVGMRMRAGLITAIYRKSFKLSAEVRQRFTVGEITSAFLYRYSQGDCLTIYVQTTCRWMRSA